MTLIFGEGVQFLVKSSRFLLTSSLSFSIESSESYDDDDDDNNNSNNLLKGCQAVVSVFPY